MVTALTLLLGRRVAEKTTDGSCEAKYPPAFSIPLLQHACYSAIQ